VVLLAAAGLIAIVALTSRSGLLVPELGVPDGSSLLTVAEVVGYVALGVGVLVVPLSMLLYRRRWRTGKGKEREDALDPLPWWMRLLGLAVVAAVVGGQTVVASTFLDEVRRAREAGQGAASGIGLPDPGTTGSAGTDLTPLIIAGVLLVAIALLAVAVAIRWRALDRPTGLAELKRRRATHEALEVSLDALRREPDPRRAVIAAYAAMERSLGRAGFGRAPSEAPLEYLRRVLDVSGLAEEDLQTITLLFQHARFSEHPVRESMRTQAIDALGGVRATIGGGA
jgi:hypothetical protein